MPTSRTHSLTAASLALLLAAGCPDPFGDDDTTAGGDDDTADDDDADDDSSGNPALDACDDTLGAETIPADDGCVQLQPYEQFDPAQEVEWQWFESTTAAAFDEVVATPIVINLTDDDGDGQIDEHDVPDVVFHCMTGGDFADGVTRAVSGADGSELWTQNDGDKRVAPNNQLAAADLDPTVPGPEIVIITLDDVVVCLDHEGGELWRTDPGEDLYRGAPAIHDMNGDGSPEVVVGRVILSSIGEILGIGEHGSGSNDGRGHMTFAVDIDDDGELEVIAGNAIYDMWGVAECSNGETDGFPAVADFDLDGDPEVAVVSHGAVRLQDHECNVLWGPFEIDGDGFGGNPTIADYDGDGYPEIGAANKHYYTVLDTDGSFLWSHPTAETSSGWTGSAVFDFNGDGTAEVVYADEENLYIFQGTDGAILLEETGHSSRTQSEYPTIVDIDNDHHAEIVLGSNPIFTPGWNGITVLGSTGEQGWWKARRIWNQHAYFSTHIEEDGTVPATQVDPWDVHNSFRQNFPPDSWAGYPAPNLRVEPTGPCLGPDGAGDVRFGVRLVNDGAAGTGADPVVALYALGGGGPQTLAVETYPEAIEAGVRSAPLYIPYEAADATDDFLARADDTGSGTGFILECDETDNDAEWPES